MASSPMLMNCSKCGTSLELPTGAKSIICAVCNDITCIDNAQQVYYGSALPLGRRGQQHGGGKKALIIGISYWNSQHELKGCLNDAKCMEYLLINQFHFPPSSILMLTEEEKDPLRIPTKHNIRMAMHWLVQGCRSGDSLVFHFSGHGSQKKNRSGDEVDGYDETLLPLDFETKGVILDDEINETLVRPLTQGVRLHAIVDACHSGTILDLPFLCKMDSEGQFVWEDHQPLSGARKGTSGGEAYSFSGCTDSQTSADTSVLANATSTGAMTFCFIQAIQSGCGKTYRDILCAIRKTIRDVRSESSGGSISSFIGLLFHGGTHSGRLIQEPQLSSAITFDIGTPFYL